ncbi:cytochrome P460 family protein [Oceaniglobus trochenteri]|uniref:cytochrome P460 family protein n=1 Tax=Oceaniglobus trochenteri TaxID=2763260 RepID=UPI001CFF98FC|nr:cytochrome P460 family protein [Oceaniglobus trochenteri]
MKPLLLATTLTIATTTGALAQDCTAEGDAFDLDAAAVAALYDCIEGTMAAQYAAEGDSVGTQYREWQVTSTRPAVAGPHGERFLQTFANDIAAEQYLKFAEEFDAMPVGAVLAKESFSLKDGKARVGPLFIMTKLEKGGAPEAGDWRYDALQPNGKAMGISQGFCAGCHLNWDYRDSLAYPLEEVRLGAE